METWHLSSKILTPVKPVEILCFSFQESQNYALRGSLQHFDNPLWTRYFFQRKKKERKKHTEKDHFNLTF